MAEELGAAKEDGVQIVCPKCSYGWTTKSKLKKVSCPSCGSKVIIIRGS